MRILIIHDECAPDARADEVDALVQAATVGRELRALGHDVEQCGVTLRLDDLATRLHADAPDLVVNLVESIGGRGSLIHLAPAVVEAASVAMTGCDAASIAQTSNKLTAKCILARAHIPTAPWVARGEWSPGWSAESGFFERPPRFEHVDKWIVKSVWEHASIGLSDASIIAAPHGDALLNLIESARTDATGEMFAEAYIDGREFNLAVLEGPDGAEVLPSAEIRFDDFAPDQARIVGYAAKWDQASFAYHHTPRSFEFEKRDAALLRELRDLALRCWREFDLSGYARVDFRVDAAGRPWVLEINANPCLSPDAGFYAAAERAGLTMRDVVERLIDAARRRADHATAARR